MRQKNTHGYPLMVPAIGRTVQPSEIVEHDSPLAGFEQADEGTDTDETSIADGEPSAPGEAAAPADKPPLGPGERTPLVAATDETGQPVATGNETVEAIR